MFLFDATRYCLSYCSLKDHIYCPAAVGPTFDAQEADQWDPPTIDALGP